VQDTLAFVLAGGEGRRLHPLTRERCKPAVHFGGRYRLVDFVLSNLVNSGFRRISVLTQYKATSLVQHVSRWWGLATHLTDEYVGTVPASQNIGPTWFRGTADAIWQNIDLLRTEKPAHVLIFGADHIYTMDVGRMVEQHRRMGAEITVATVRMPRRDASSFGCVSVDAAGWVTGFLEKPADPPGIPGDPEHTLVSMGNYAFTTEALLRELRSNAAREPGATTHDFGRDILSNAPGRIGIAAYDFASHLCPGDHEHARGYWRDVGTLDAYYAASMDLVDVQPHLNLYNERWPIRGAQPGVGPCKFVFADAKGKRVGEARDSIVGAGTIVSGAHLERSVCSHQVRLHSRARVEESVLFPGVEVGERAQLRRCIVDKGVWIPEGMEIGLHPDEDRKRFTVSEGGVVVVSRASLGQDDEYDIK
jgi:glucose-1-phosphate adenylyltransferase